MTRVKLVHLRELREALGDAYVSPGVWCRAGAPWRLAGTTPISAAHVKELRFVVVALE